MSRTAPHADDSHAATHETLHYCIYRKWHGRINPERDKSQTNRRLRFRVAHAMQLEPSHKLRMAHDTHGMNTHSHGFEAKFA